MRNTRREDRPDQAQIVHFDEVLLNACGAELRRQLLAEAAMLADAFAPERRTEELLAMAATLASGARDAEMDREHALRLAYALRCLARGVGA